jgi:predicted RNase H-like nuclease (RuvC/YqgF family)
MKQDQTPLSMKTLFQPENEAEAYAVRAMLAEQGIGAVIHSFHDSACDGLFQSQ